MIVKLVPHPKHDQEYEILKMRLLQWPQVQHLLRERNTTHIHHVHEAQLEHDQN